MNAPVLLSPEHIAMVDRGVSVIVASRDAALRPSIMRGVGSAISADGTQVTVFLRRSQSRQLMRDIEGRRGLAVVFSEPPRTAPLQLKARQASLRPASPTDQPQLGATWPRCNANWPRWATGRNSRPPCFRLHWRTWWPCSSRRERL